MASAIFQETARDECSGAYRLQPGFDVNFDDGDTFYLRVTLPGLGLALLPDSTVRVWGEDRSGVVNPAIARQVALLAPAMQIAAGHYLSCALLFDGRVECWGSYVTGPPELSSPVRLGGSAREVAVGEFHACAPLEGGRVRCWGRNDKGQLGYGHKITIGDDEAPQDAGDVDLGGPAAQLCAGSGHRSRSPLAPVRATRLHLSPTR